MNNNNIDLYQGTTLQTAIYPRSFPENNRDQPEGQIQLNQRAIEYTVIGMAGEAGEALEFVKKLMRGDYGSDGIHHPEFQAGIQKEMGDVIWYWSRACAELGILASEILELNNQKLRDRAERGVVQGSGNNR